jgi:hypothetical protein
MMLVLSTLCQKKSSHNNNVIFSGWTRLDIEYGIFCSRWRLQAMHYEQIRESWIIIDFQTYKGVS